MYFLDKRALSQDEEHERFRTSGLGQVVCVDEEDMLDGIFIAKF